MLIDGVELKVEKISFSGGGPRFSFEETLNGKIYAAPSGREPLRVSAPFTVPREERSSFEQTRERYEKGRLVEVSIDREFAFTGVITRLSWEDDGELIRGQIEVTQADGVAGEEV